MESAHKHRKMGSGDPSHKDKKLEPYMPKRNTQLPIPVNEDVANAAAAYGRQIRDAYESDILRLHTLYQKEIIPKLLQRAITANLGLDGDVEDLAKILIEESGAYQKARGIVFGSFFRESIKDFPWMDKIYKIAEENAEGSRTAILGGFVYRNIARLRYGQIPLPGPTDKINVDLVVEEKPVMDKRLYAPRGWSLIATKYGVSFKKNNISVDWNYLEGFHALQERSNPKLEDIFSFTPLNVQAIFYDIESETVIGDMGIKAIDEKKIRVNNAYEAHRLAEIIRKKRGERFTVDDLVEERAKGLKFTIEL